VRNPCIGCKDCTIVLIYFCLGTNFFGHDWVFPSCHVDVLALSCSSNVIDVVDCTLLSLVMDCMHSFNCCVCSQYKCFLK
jgi:hypothetical protein